MRRTGRAACLVALMALIVSLSVVKAEAAGFHAYSIAGDTNHTYYTGTQNTRVDKHVVVANTGCSAYYTGNPIYQTQWVLLSDDAKNWMEFGAGHQCADDKVYWYMGYGTAGAWYPIYEVDNPTENVSRAYKIKRTEGSLWGFYVGGTRYAWTVWDRSGVYVQSGIESYDQNGALTSYTHSSLQYTRLEGAWTDWQSRDYSLVSSSEMCGGWNSDTSWRMSENRTC